MTPTVASGARSTHDVRRTPAAKVTVDPVDCAVMLWDEDGRGWSMSASHPNLLVEMVGRKVLDILGIHYGD